MTDLVSRQKSQSSLVLTLNRPGKRNALSRDLIATLGEAFESAARDANIRSVILTGAGPVFCAGMDLHELQQSISRPADTSPIWEDAKALAALYDLIYHLEKPTVAAVQGPAIAGGAGLVAVCDLAISTPEATFGYPEVRRGLVAAMVMPHLLRHVGERMARYLLLSGELIDAEQALRCGLINEVVAEDFLIEQALELGHSCSLGGPRALATTKTLLSRFSRQAMSLDEAARGSAEPRLTQECRDGLKAFFDKKLPPWSNDA